MLVKYEDGRLTVSAETEFEGEELGYYGEVEVQQLSISKDPSVIHFRLPNGDEKSIDYKKEGIENGICIGYPRGWEV